MKYTNMNVELIDNMGTDLSVVNSARVSFAKNKEVIDSSDKKLIQFLANNNHWSPFCHCTVTLRVKAPIFVSRQLVKHTVGLTINEESRRYITEEPEFYIPDSLRKSNPNKKQGSLEEPVDHNDYCLKLIDSVNTLALETYLCLLDQDVCPEQARAVLPLNTMTNWYWTGSLYAFARVCNLRLKSDAQKETMELCLKINNIMKKLYPISWKALIKE